MIKEHGLHVVWDRKVICVYCKQMTLKLDKLKVHAPNQKTNETMKSMIRPAVLIFWLKGLLLTPAQLLVVSLIMGLSLC